MLEAAIVAGAIDVRFQPWIELSSGRVVAVEALARSAIELDAGQLFARAHRAGLAVELSQSIQRRALARAASWSGPLGELPVSINLLACELADPSRLAWFAEEVARSGCDPHRIIVEITEDSLLVERQSLGDDLQRLRDAGVRIALDDFGTGYASLAYLTRLPLDILKFDRDLAVGLVGGHRDQIVMKAMIDLASELSLRTVVEGVEDPAQLALLEEWGCDYFQGFLGARALDEGDLAAFVGSTGRKAA